MIGLRRKGLAITGAAALTAGLLGMAPATTAGAAVVGTPFSQAAFAAYGTGSELHVHALASGSSTLASVEQAFSANNVKSAALGNLGGAVNSPITTALVQTPQPGFNAYGRGSGLEVGLGLTPAQANQVQLGIAEAAAPPTVAPFTKTAIPLNLDPLLNVGLLTGVAGAAYSTNSVCPIGQPIAYGEGDAAAPTAVVGTPPPTALVSGTGASGTQAAQSRTLTQLKANADGTFGITNTVTEIITPVTVNLGPSVTLAVTVQGDGPNSPFTVQTFNDGEGNTGVTFANNDPVVKIDLIVSGVTTTLANVKLSLLQALINPLLGTGSTIQLTLAALGVNLSVDVGKQTTIPGVAAGTTSVAYDLLAINASLTGVLASVPLTIADLRLGHVESAVYLPSGPITCSIPVGKVATPPTVTAGGTFTTTISIPSTATALADTKCDLTHISATDVIGVASGHPTFTVTAVSNNGKYDPATQTVTWADLGSYTVGQPPITVTVTFAVPANSPAGVLMDTANVKAGLSCSGGANSTAALTGKITLMQPQVTSGNGGNLAATGNGPLLAWAGALLLMMAAGTRRILRRADAPKLN